MKQVYIEEKLSIEKQDGRVIYRYTPADGTHCTYGGTNLALGCKGCSNDGSDTSAAFDGNYENTWCCEVEDNAWLQVDLGKSVRIGRTEVWARADGDGEYTDPERINMEILGSDDPEMNEYDIIGRQAAIPFPKHGAWICDCNTEKAYRYLRLRRMYGSDKICSVFDMKALAVSEFAVYDEPTGRAEKVIYDAPESALMIIAANGGALTQYGNYAVTEGYRFRNDQRWIMTENGRIQNVESGLYLGAADEIIFDAEGKNEEFRWITAPDRAGWTKLINGAGKQISIIDGQLCLGEPAGEKEQRWMLVAAYREDTAKGSTEVLTKGYGIMYHLLVSKQDIGSVHKQLDYDRMADYFDVVNAKYFLLATGQGSGAYIAPNEIYPSVTGEEYTQCNPSEDIFGKLADAMAHKGIDTIAYVTAIPPHSMEAFGMPKEMEPCSLEATMLWSLVIREWSVRYGEKVKGWWMDGGYLFYIHDINIHKYYTAAMKAGNPDCAIAISNGLALYPNPNALTDEYTAGEVDFPFAENGWRTCYRGMVNTNLKEIPEEFFKDKDKRVEVEGEDEWLTPKNWPLDMDKQWYVLTFIGKGWKSNGGPRKALYPKELWAKYVATVLEQGGAITLDCDYDLEDGGLPVDYAREILEEVGRKV